MLDRATIERTETIGLATLHLGDAYAILPTLGRLDILCTDPPYLIRASGAGSYRKRRPMMDRIMEEGLHQGFNLSIIDPLQFSAAVIFAHNDQLAELLAHVKGGFHRHALCVWQKTNPQPVANKHYRPDAEFYVHSWQRGCHPIGDMADLLRITRTSSPRGAARFDHPTTKPDALMEKIVRNLAAGAICDPFMGTGSTGVAAVKAGRRFIGIEKNPAHYETACRRLAQAQSLA